MNLQRYVEAVWDARHAGESWAEAAEKVLRAWEGVDLRSLMSARDLESTPDGVCLHRAAHFELMVQVQPPSRGPFVRAPEGAIKLLNGEVQVFRADFEPDAEGEGWRTGSVRVRLERVLRAGDVLRLDQDGPWLRTRSSSSVAWLSVRAGAPSPWTTWGAGLSLRRPSLDLAFRQRARCLDLFERAGRPTSKAMQVWVRRAPASALMHWLVEEGRAGRERRVASALGHAVAIRGREPFWRVPAVLAEARGS